jgi:GAF domain-containing protein
MANFRSLLGRTYFRIWSKRTRAVIMAAARPLDEPRVCASGPDPDRILLFGSDVFVGRGVLSHEVAFPGHLARTVAKATGRGVGVHIQAHTDLTIRAAVQQARLLDLFRYDAVMVDLGMADALAATSGAEWAAQLEVLLEILTSRITSSGRIFFIANPDPMILAGSQTWGVRRLRRICLDYNIRSEEVASQFDHVTFLSFPVQHEQSTGRLHTARTFEGFAATLAPALTDHLQNQFLDSGPRSGPVRSEEKRQDSVDRLRIVDTGPEERFDRIVAQARRKFGTEFASFNIIDQDRRWIKSHAGSPTSSNNSRADSFCNTTIHEHSALVIGNMLEDPRFAENPLVTADPHLRFYIGYPIEAPNGERIGALCVYDRTPRTIYGSEETTIRDLAIQIERELWTMPGKKARTGHTRT